MMVDGTLPGGELEVCESSEDCNGPKPSQKVCPGKCVKCTMVYGPGLAAEGLH